MTFGSVEIAVTGGEIRIGKELLGAEQSYTHNALTIERRGEHVFLTYSAGVKIKWSVDSLSVFLTIDTQFKNKVNGLCGDYNGQKGYDKDLLLPDGTFTTDVALFGNSWRLDMGVSCLIINYFISFRFRFVFDQYFGMCKILF
jgi:hypothetical protein